MVINTFKSSTELSQAINQLANKRSTGLSRISSGAVVRDILNRDPEIKMELEKIKMKAK